MFKDLLTLSNRILQVPQERKVLPVYQVNNL